MEIQNPFQITWDKTPYPTFTDYFFNKISVYGSNLAIVDTDSGKTWRFSEIRLWVNMAVDRLREMGVTEKSRVAVITGTTGQAIFIHLACSMIGCSAVAVNGWLTVDEIWQMVDLSESTQCVAEVPFMQKADDVRRKAQMRGGGRIKSVKCIEDVLSSDSLTDKRINNVTKPPLTREPSSAKIAVPPVVEEIITNDIQSPISETATSVGKPDSEENSDSMEFAPHTGNPLILFFTSGTTGLPKPVEYSHRSLIINLQQISQPVYGPVQPKEKFLLPLAISHMFGSISAYYALINGATVFTINKWTPKLLVDALADHKINVLHCTAPMLNMLAIDPLAENFVAASLRSIVVSGSPIDGNMIKLCKERLKLKDVRQVFGMTELGGICTMAHFECDKGSSVGVPLPGMLVKVSPYWPNYLPDEVVNWETKQSCAPHQPGQLMVMGPQCQPNYFKNPKATSEIIDQNGYIRTGDAAYYDEEGYLYILDRIKDIIKYKGTLVCPSEVELLLRAHPGIDDCAVVGRQDHVTGEVPAAFVVKSSSHPLLASAEVRQYVSGKIAQFKELRGGVFFISDIPRSFCGKVLRRQLRQFWDRERTNSKADLTEKPKSATKTPTKTAGKTLTKPAGRPSSGARK